MKKKVNNNNNAIYLANFSKKLSTILASEIKLGNKIDSIGIDYPIKGAVWVMLEKPFLQTYSITNVAYQKVNDIHYWFEEYEDKSLQHLLLTDFER
jgi:hypothetical protein